jgi:hypothetical protein
MIALKLGFDICKSSSFFKANYLSSEDFRLVRFFLDS